MRVGNPFHGWNIGKKTMFSHLLIASLSIVLATVLCYIFGYQFTQSNAVEELERQVRIIARKEGNLNFAERASRGYVVELYQDLTNAAVFFVDDEGDEAPLMQRYNPSAGVQDAGGASQSDYSAIELLDTIDRQFIDRVLSGETFTTIRQFTFAGGVIVFAGAPIVDANGEIVGGVVLAQPVEIMRAISRELGLLLSVAAGIAILLAVVLAVGQNADARATNRAHDARGAQDGGWRLRRPRRGDVRRRDRRAGPHADTLSLRLVETIDSLREERDRLELVIGSIEEGLLAVDRAMGVVHCNLSFLEMMELDAVGDIYDSPRADVDQLLQAIREALESGENRRASLTNPSDRAILVEITALPTAKNDQVGAVCLLTDVSESQRMEQLRRDYVANISHELRTPLTGIRGMIEPLMDGYVDTEEERQNCYAIIQQETVRLEKLVGEMLDMSRLQDGRATVEMERLELPGILEAAARSMSALARDAGVGAARRDRRLAISVHGQRGPHRAGAGHSARQRHRLYAARRQRDGICARRWAQAGDRRRARYRLRHRAEGPAADLGAFL